jgi:hypothetical protein
MELPRSGNTTLATGFNPWNTVSTTPQPRRGGTMSSVAPTGLVSWRGTFVHGLKPVAKVVLPLRGATPSTALGVHSFRRVQEV